MADTQVDPRFRQYWGLALLYTLGVILFGAVVRITGSGAGCGQHWPTCQGEVAHLPQSVETLIEFTHRVTSGLSLVVIIGLSFYAFRRWPVGHQVRRAAGWSTALILVESLIGAALVLLQYVGDNDSLGRAVIMGAHLVNTLALTGAISWVVLSSSGRVARLEWRAPAAPYLALGTLSIAAVAAAGALTALGDTLYPVASDGIISEQVIAQGTAAQSSGVHFLERLRGVHPLMAVVGSGLLIWMVPAIVNRCAAPERGAVWGRALTWCIYGQLALGLLNVWLSAPGWMQVVHLAAALVLWLCWVGLAYEALILRVRQTAMVAPAGNTVASG